MMMEIQMEHQDAIVFVLIKSMVGYVLEGQHFHQALVILFVETELSLTLSNVMIIIRLMETDVQVPVVLKQGTNVLD